MGEKFTRPAGFKLALEVVCDFSLAPGMSTWVALTAQRSLSPNTLGLLQTVSPYVSTLDLFAGQVIFLILHTLL